MIVKQTLHDLTAACPSVAPRKEPTSWTSNASRCHASADTTAVYTQVQFLRAVREDIGPSSPFIEFVLDAAFQNAADQIWVMSKIDAKLRIFASPPVNIRRGVAEMSVWKIKYSPIPYDGQPLRGGWEPSSSKKESSLVSLKAGGLIITMTN